MPWSAGAGCIDQVSTCSFPIAYAQFLSLVPYDLIRPGFHQASIAALRVGVGLFALRLSAASFGVKNHSLGLARASARASCSNSLRPLPRPSVDSLSDLGYFALLYVGAALPYCMRHATQVKRTQLPIFNGSLLSKYASILSKHRRLRTFQIVTYAARVLEPQCHKQAAKKNPA